METQEIRGIITRGLNREKMTDTLAGVVTLRFGEMGRILSSEEVTRVVELTRQYVRDVPDLLDEVELVAKEEGWYDLATPIFDVAERCFLESLDEVPDEEGTKELIHDAYIIHTVVQGVSEALKAHRKKALQVRSTVEANKLVRQVLGEETALFLDNSAKEKLRESIERISKRQPLIWIDPADAAQTAPEPEKSFSFEHYKPEKHFDLSSDEFPSSDKSHESWRSASQYADAPAPPSESASAATGTTSPVLLGVSAPSAIKPGEEFTARFVAYVKELEEEVRNLLEKLSPRAEPILGVKKCRWKVGTKVEVRLSSRHLNISPEVQEFEWSGTRDMLDFDVEVPPDAAECTQVLKFDVAIDKFVVARIRLDLEVSRRASSLDRKSAHTGVARTAFASYSADDRQRVLDRVSSVSICAGLDIFFDCLSLHANEDWKARLETEIRNRDLFLLFWSRNANKSEWVTWEWKTALEAKGKESMQIHPLEPDVRPPTELAELHAGDPYMWVRKGMGNT